MSGAEYPHGRSAGAPGAAAWSAVAGLSVAVIVAVAAVSPPVQRWVLPLAAAAGLCVAVAVWGGRRTDDDPGPGP